MQLSRKYSIIFLGDRMKTRLKQLLKNIKLKNFWKRLIITVICIFILAINYNLFLLYNNLVIGGASGISIIVNEYLNITPSLFLLLFNIVSIIISFWLLGIKTTSMTIVGSLLYPLFVQLTSPWCASFAPKIVLDNFLLVVLISGILFGIANGLIYRTGYSTGGVDTIIQVISKYMKLKTGTVSFIVNFLIIISGGIIFGLSKAVYATIIIVINSYLVDKIMLGISDSKLFYINTKKTEEIKKVINEFNNGFTLLNVEGGYTNEVNSMIMCVVPTSKYYIFKNIIQNIDPHAFIIISDCYEVYGGQRKEKFSFL